MGLFKDLTPDMHCTGSSTCKYRRGAAEVCGKPARTMLLTDDPLDRVDLCPEHRRAVDALRKVGGLPPARALLLSGGLT